MNGKSLHIILTGSTGMVGEGVLLECLSNDLVQSVVIINRKPGGFQHPKLKEIIHSDFSDITSIKDQLTGYNTCLFCAGVTSVGKSEEEYFKLTYTLTLGFAKTISAIPGMTFCYISGSGTDSSEKGKVMWARVKGKTENDLTKLPFKAVYNVRPAIMQPTSGQKNVLSFYKYFKWLVPIIKLVSPKSIITIRQLGQAMINAAANGYSKNIIEVKDIHLLAERSS